jgi:hypothetical protein
LTKAAHDVNACLPVFDEFLALRDSNFCSDWEGKAGLMKSLARRSGFDHEKLTFHHAGRDFRLTDVHGTVVKGILA